MMPDLKTALIIAMKDAGSDIHHDYTTGEYVRGVVEFIAKLYLPSVPIMVAREMVYTAINSGEM